ncbi:hypothetical protein EII40_13720 [Tannerella forsythia]|uniref:Uncharacterized protein n=1 Tax=Tannerella forsythia TaxID=28112 RepID=A0A3P1XF03_TANFO|nr:hypothetical protein EII40_13720 [Tannerella forsythia]
MSLIVFYPKALRQIQLHCNLLRRQRLMQMRMDEIHNTVRRFLIELLGVLFHCLFFVFRLQS